MQPYLFPHIGYFQLMNAVDKFVVYDDVTFIKSGWINRNQILFNRVTSTFTVPLNNAGSNELIKDIKVDQNRRWQKKLIKGIKQSYHRAPYFSEVFELVSDVITGGSVFIKDMHLHSFRLIKAYTGINTCIIDSSIIYKNDQLSGQNRVIDICRLEKANHYINSIGGRQLYKKQAFCKAGIKLSFIDSEDIVYPQFAERFVPQLSIVDVLMFNSPESTLEMLARYKLL
jgi:hypothetical protein